MAINTRKGKGLKSKLGNINRILVRGVNWVGDTILSYPAIQEVKELFPSSHLTILVPNHLVDLWKTFPYVDEIIPLQKKVGVKSFWDDLRLGQSLRREGFDLALILPRSFRSAFQVYLARIPVRIGYGDEGRSFFLTHQIPRTEEILRIHRIDYYRRLIEPLGRKEAVPAPRLFLRQEDREWAGEKLGELGVTEGRLLIGFNPGATYGMAKCWSPARFGELGRRLSEKRKAFLLVFGVKQEGEMAREILKYLDHGGVDLTGKTHLLQLAALLERCHLLVTNDTGTMHMAAAVGTPVMAIFGSTDSVTTGPWGEGHTVVKREVSCSPCLKRVCPTDHRCMDLITVEEVEEVINKKLGELRQRTMNHEQ